MHYNVDIYYTCKHLLVILIAERLHSRFFSTGHRQQFAWRIKLGPYDCPKLVGQALANIPSSSNGSLLAWRRIPGAKRALCL
jgi:hypothetical protein